jgi:hypothetical protein
VFAEFEINLCKGRQLEGIAGAKAKQGLRRQRLPGFDRRGHNSRELGFRVMFPMPKQPNSTPGKKPRSLAESGRRPAAQRATR